MDGKYTAAILLSGLIISIACKKERKEEEKKSASQLLTQKEWILTGHGFDDNKNDFVDSTENIIAECQKDNTYIFRTDGSGANFENAHSCGTDAPVNNFTWKLANNNSIIDMDYFKARIMLLDENKLIISPYDSINFPVKDFLISFRR